MKNQLRRLKVLLNMFPEDAFYTTSIKKDSIDLQGEFKANIVLVARKNKFIDVGLCEKNGYVEMKRDNICIVLTD